LVHAVLRRLTSRDWQIIRLLHNHRVLTTHHICDAFFPSPRAAEMRLLDLYYQRVVDHFRPLAPSGSAPYHWILDEIGAQLIAWQRGVDLKQLGWRRERALGIAASPQLGHRLGVNGFFCALLRAARQTYGCRLSVWRECHELSGSSTFVEPDGFGVWQEAGWEQPFYLEYDCGTERLERLAGKLERYRSVVPNLDARFDPDYARLLLFVFPSPLREKNARTVLTDDPWVRVATTVAVPAWGVPPNAAIWAPVGGVDTAARRLIDLRAAWPRRGTTAPTAADGGANRPEEDEEDAEDPWARSDAELDDTEDETA
jgi:Replication-relaxation